MNRLSKKEKGFADDYLETGNGVESALKNYDTEDYSSAGVIAHENLKKLKIQRYLADKAEDASSMVYKLSQNAENEAVRLNASKDILDRSGFKPVEKTVNLNLEAEITNPKAVELAKKYEEELKKSL